MPVLSEDSYVIIDPFFVPGSWQRCGSGGKDGKGILTLLRNSTASTGATLPSTTGMAAGRPWTSARPPRQERKYFGHGTVVQCMGMSNFSFRQSSMAWCWTSSGTSRGRAFCCSSSFFHVLLCCANLFKGWPGSLWQTKWSVRHFPGGLLASQLQHVATLARCTGTGSLKGLPPNGTSGSSLALGANAKASMQVAFPFCGFPSTLGRLGLLPRLLGTWRCGCTATGCARART